MTLTQPRAKTIKRLFAVAHNRCAFPGCSSTLVHGSGTITGEICHIKAQTREGPRFDANQSDEERHGFENLILMCGTHHKLIDEHLSEFPVERLVQMKRDHEAGPVGEEPDDSTVDRLLANSGFSPRIDQRANSGGVNVVARDSTVIVGQGLTYRDAKAIALDVYRANALELRGIAESVARERAEALTTAFLERLRQIEAMPPATLSDPDMHHVLFEAQRLASRAGQPELDQILVDLLIERATKPGRGLLQIVLGEAVTTAGRLSPDQFDALTLVFVLKYSRQLNVRTIEDLAGYLLANVDPFLHGAARSRASFQHLEYAGCGSLGIAATQLSDLLRNVYAHCFVLRLLEAELQSALGLSSEAIERLTVAGCWTRGALGLDLAPRFDIETEGLFANAGIDLGIHVRYRKMLVDMAKQVPPEEVRRAYPHWDKLDAWWREFPAHFQLTSVGIAIAHANLRRRGVGGFDLRTWIN